MWGGWAKHGASSFISATNMIYLVTLWSCYLLSYRGKRSTNYPAHGKSYNILPPLERRNLWDVSVDGCPYSVVRAYPNFDPHPGDSGRHAYNKTHAQALLVKEIFEVGFEVVSCRRRQMWWCYLLSYRGKDRSTTQPRVSLTRITFETITTTW